MPSLELKKLLELSSSKASFYKHRERSPIEKVWEFIPWRSDDRFADSSADFAFHFKVQISHN